MSGRRYEPEWALAEIFESYLDEVLDEELFSKSPVVTFFDPMAQDEAERVVVLVHDVETSADGVSNFAAVVEVTVKSQLKKPTLAEDMAAHFERTKAVRDVLCATNLMTELDAVDDGLGVDGVNKRRGMRTQLADGWIYSETKLTVKCFARAAA